jgi:hypothetical protein
LLEFGYADVEVTVNVLPADASGSERHLAYISGYPDGSVHPTANITRAEVCQIIYKAILPTELKAANATTANPFTDVPSGEWYAAAILTCSKLGLVSGYPDGEFKPNKQITRAEAAQILGGAKTGGIIGILGAQNVAANAGVVYADVDAVPGFWAATAIYNVAKAGWMRGRTATDFGLGEMTRAEFITMANRILEREPESVSDLLDGMKTWTDNADVNAWYYREVQEATNSHEYVRKETKSASRPYYYEKWTALLN